MFVCDQMMPKTLYNSSTPIKPKFDPVSKNSSTANMNYEKIFPGIYLTSVKNLCPPDDLKIYGFTHIIYIDKHIMNSVPNSSTTGQHNVSYKRDHAHVIKNTETSVTASITIRQTNQTSSTSCEPGPSAGASTSMNRNTSKPSTSACSSMSFNNEMPIDDESSMKQAANNENLFGHSDFETLDLNFGESTYFTANVLPNCYKAVAFIENALKNNGAVLVIDCIYAGENQKCITIVIGFLMYKYNKNFL